MKKSVNIKIAYPSINKFCTLMLKEKGSRKIWRVIKGTPQELLLFKLKNKRKGEWFQTIKEKERGFYEVNIHIGDLWIISLKKVPLNFLLMKGLMYDGNFTIDNPFDQSELFGKWSIREKIR